MTRYRYAIAPTPIGPALIAWSAAGLVSLRIANGEAEWELDALARDLGTLPDLDPAAAAPIARQLDEYFAGRRREFDVELDWRRSGGFHADALRAVRDIPYGTTASYGEIAAAAGRPGAARAVGTACRLAPFSLVVPVHRVVRADGSLGHYGARPEVKRFLIDLERSAGDVSAARRAGGVR